MWINLTPDDVEIIRTIPALAVLKERITDMERDIAASALAIEQARDDYARCSNDDIEVDDCPSVSVADEGVWVMAWLWEPQE